ncbi:hypothetical protein BI364_15505 [Acidihalobacter yilgarnensis]|uniref:Threonyl/alanyl tRNA synthetase SAD domain-containing protein n=1 Tax=Acidihalobacter yilgarnensis TaxID=2819280 RepID=A0A1D8ITP8_9GAMM|nr:hypothetical protein [Acidihalobacter yilgarnensis]AOU99803.1 hypothetical protein BI364_15505 [Acidihalobacter yilgarnensis]
MTLRKYFLSDQSASSARVLSCSGNDGAYRIILRETLFHPQGGGQPADQGWIADARIQHVTQEQDVIIHHAETPVTPGNVETRIDEVLRHLHSRLHSAGHLIGNLGALLGWRPIKANHAQDKASVTFKAGDHAQTLDETALQERLHGLVRQNLPRQVVVDADGFRTIGFGGLQPFPCGGTHVTSTGEIGEIVLRGIKHSKGSTTIAYDVRA